MKKGVLEEGEDTLGGYLAGLVAPGGHQQRGGRGERSRETAHLPTLKNRIKYIVLCPCFVQVCYSQRFLEIL